jgi:hypothetical protein
MSLHEWFGVVSSSLSIGAYLIYLRTCLGGQTKPHVFSWVVWTLLSGVIFVVQIREGAGPGAWVMATSVVFCLLITLFALWRGERQVTLGDWAAFAGALVVIPVWQLASNPELAVVLATLIDALAYYPTYRKSWLRPREENVWIYAIEVPKMSFALAALDRWSLSVALYPAFVLAANFCLALLIALRRRNGGRDATCR